MPVWLAESAELTTFKMSSEVIFSNAADAKSVGVSPGCA
jgi:hypothetical protein